MLAEKDEERLALVYCLGSWLGPQKEQIVYAWVNQFFHRGTTTTSRLEGHHAKLKGWLKGQNKDLTTFFHGVSLTLAHEFHERRASIASSKARNPIALQGTFSIELNS